VADGTGVVVFLKSESEEPSDEELGERDGNGIGDTTGSGADVGVGVSGDSGDGDGSGVSNGAGDGDGIGLSCALASMTRIWSTTKTNFMLFDCTGKLNMAFGS
jgi:hypothetical protein